MSLSDDFTDKSYKTQKINSCVLGVQYGCGSGATTYLTYDFLARIMIVRTGSSDGGASATPFSQLDRESLISLRDRLVDLGGKPPELPMEAPATQAAQRKLNL